MDVNKAEIESLQRAAVIAGVTVLVMALTVPIVEFYIFPKLIDYRNAEQTTHNIANHIPLFSTAIFIHFTTVVCDIISGWALYIFFRPVNKNLALLTGCFRIVNAAFTLTALLNLIQVLTIIKTPENSVFESDQVSGLVLFYLRSFNLQWRFMLVFFGIYMNLLGFLAIRSKYVPKIIGSMLIVAGVGYVVDDLKYFFYPTLDTGFLWFTYLGELVFMFWLLIKGSRIQKIES